MCEGIYRASMINGDVNAVQDSLSSGSSTDADPNDAAKGHCRMMDNEAEIELCLSFLSTFLELMSKKAELDDWTQVSKHSFIFYAEKLMAFNPEFAYVVFFFVCVFASVVFECLITFTIRSSSMIMNDIIHTHTHKHTGTST